MKCKQIHKKILKNDRYNLLTELKENLRRIIQKQNELIPGFILEVYWNLHT